MSQNFTCHGFIGQDPELKNFPDGTPVVNFSVASTNRWKDKKTGEIKESTDWFRMVATGSSAEIIAEYFSKGSEIVITKSRFKQRKYEKNGVDHYMSEFFVESFDFCGKKSGGDSKTDQQAKAYSADNSPPVKSDFDDDIPF